MAERALYIDPSAYERFKDREANRGELREQHEQHLDLLKRGDHAALTRALQDQGRLEAASGALEDLRGPRGEQLESLGPLSREVLERILGANDLVHVRYLSRGQRAARSVIRVHLDGDAIGTGWLIARGLICTNNHVLSTEDEARRARFELFYETPEGGGDPAARSLKASPDRFFLTDVGLDYTIVAFEPADGLPAPLVVGGGVALKLTVNILQHPQAGLKQVGLRASSVTDLPDTRHVHYSTDTEPGSSGSPVLNDDWVVVALHHSGVPATNTAGQTIAADGTPTNGRAPNPPIEWIANEGIRMDQIVAHVERRLAASSPQRALWEDRPRSWAQLLQWDGAPQVHSGAGSASSSVSGTGTSAVTTPVVTASSAYYDPIADAAIRDAYYRGVADTLDDDARFDALSTLLRETHTSPRNYSPSAHVYPNVDKHPDGLIHSIYSGQSYTEAQLRDMDEAIRRLRLRRLEEWAREEGFNPGVESVDERLERELPYNCEHVVPQSWFSKREPMRGDLHHLFACESTCNSFRSNFAYMDFPHYQEAIKRGCGCAEEGRFEPYRGKARVARATLYFLIRYPGVISAVRREDLSTLVAWARAEPPDDYERHRNVEIQRIQGNRNPLIDHPEWLDRVAFARGLR